MNKLTKKWQMTLYATSGMGVNMLNLMFTSYLCSALLVGGFGEAVLPFQTYIGRDLVVLGVWTAFGFAAKVLDGIIDIPMASFTDRLKTRFGRRRPAIVIGFVPMVIAYLLFLVIPVREASMLNTVYYGIILCVFYSFYTLTMVTYYATFTEIVGLQEERSYISNVKSVCDILYFILGYVVVRAMLNSINVRTVALIVLPLSLTMMIPLFMIKEQSTLGESAPDAPKTVNLIKSLRYTFKNRDFIIWMIVYSFMTFGVQLFLGGINEFFSKVGMNMIIVMACSFAPVPLTLLLYNKINRDRGFGFAFRYILLTFTASMVSMYFIGNKVSDPGAKTVLSVVGGLLASFAIGALFAVAYSVPAQLAADEEKKTGISNSAMYFAVQGLFSGIASGIGANIVLNALKGTEEAASNAIIYMTLVSAAGTAAAFALSFLLPRSVSMMGKKDRAVQDKKDK